MPDTSEQKEQIVDAALMLAENSSWESVRLFKIAEHLQIELEDIRQVFREKEDIVDAWFDRADQAMLQAAQENEDRQVSTEERLHQIIMAWFEFIQPYRRCSRQMILNKLEFGHLHYQWAGAMRVSRTVQWIREAAGRPQSLPWRAVEEMVLTSIYLATVAVWMTDESESLTSTSGFLRKRLRCAGHLNSCIQNFGDSLGMRSTPVAPDNR